MQPLYTVLYIDDDANLAGATGDLLRNALRPLGIDLRKFTSADAVYVFLGKPADPQEKLALAIVDLWMINKTTNRQSKDEGFSVIKELRRRYPSLFIMVVSAHITPKAKEDLDAYKQMAIISKTITPPQLISTVEKSLRDMGIVT